MQKTSKLIITIAALVVTVSLMSNVLVFANGDGYETVGGEVAPINFVTTFLVPALIIIGVFVALVILGVIRIRFDSGADKSA
jgi:hypothetical protein